MTYSLEDLKRLQEFYRHQLLSDTIPFWFPRSFDHEFGGFLLMRDADGSLIDERESFGYSSLVTVGTDRIGILYEGIRDLYFVTYPIDRIIK